MTLKNLGKEKLLPKIVAAAALVWLLVVMVGCTNNADAATPKHESPSKPEEPKYLASRVGYDELKLHGKFRQYEVNTAKGDRTDKYSDGSQNGLFDMPAGAIATKDGKTIETPTYWSRIPLSIQPTPLTGAYNSNPVCPDTHCEKGLYSIHNAGTSQIFPKSYFTEYTAREKDSNNRQATSGVYVAFATDSNNIKLHYRYIMKGNTNTGAGSRAFSGIDIYEIDESGTPQFKENLRGTNDSGTFEYNCQRGANSEEVKKFMVMLPTYNGFEFKDSVDANDKAGKSGLTFEFDEDAKTYEIEVFNESKQKPILIYGTSITQGDGNGNLRPGATYGAQIMFAAKREVINCGFAGSAQMEYKMADFLANIDAEVFVIDPGWNLTVAPSGNSNTEACTANGAPANISNQEVIDRAKYMIKKYREKNPDTPIIVCPKFLSGYTTAKPVTDINNLSNVTKLMNGLGNWQNNFSGCTMSREGLLLYAAYLECKKDTSKLYWACQDAKGTTWNAQNCNFINCNDLHPCAKGMTSIANFILRCLTKNVPDVYNSGDVSVPEGCNVHSVTHQP